MERPLTGGSVGYCIRLSLRRSSVCAKTRACDILRYTLWTDLGTVLSLCYITSLSFVENKSSRKFTVFVPLKLREIVWNIW